MMDTSEHDERRPPRGMSRSALPLVVIAAGAYWLYRANRRRVNGFADYQDYAEYSEFDFGPGPVDDTEETGDVTRGVGDKLSGLVGGTRARVGDLTRRTQSRLERGVQNRPLALAALAIAAGVVVGLALPGSERERRLMGDARDRVVGRAQQAARGAKTRVREAVGLKTS